MTTDDFPFTLDRVSGGWQVYDAERAKSDEELLDERIAMSDREAARGSLILNRLVPAPDHGAGFRRDPETGFVYYSSEWLGDERESDDA